MLCQDLRELCDRHWPQRGLTISIPADPYVHRNSVSFLTVVEINYPQLRVTTSDPPCTSVTIHVTPNVKIVFSVQVSESKREAKSRISRLCPEKVLTALREEWEDSGMRRRKRHSFAQQEDACFFCLSYDCQY